MFATDNVLAVDSSEFCNISQVTQVFHFSDRNVCYESFLPLV